MSDFSELDLLESKLKHLIKELSNYNQVHKLLVIPKDSPCCVRKDDRYVKRSKCDTRHVASCSSEDDLDNSSGTESEYLERSSNSMFSTLKQLQQIEKGLRKKELEIKKKELQERINTVKHRLEQQKMSRKMSEVVLKKRGGKSKKNSRHISKHIRDDTEYKKKITDVLRCAEKSETTLTTDSKADNICECMNDDGSRPNNTGVCTCLKKKISFKTACCSTNSLPCAPNYNTLNPKSSKKKLHDKKRHNKFKGMLTKWQGVERSYWSPCRCEATTHQASSLERMVQDAYGDCFPMTLRRNPMMSMYDRPKSPKKPRCVWCRSLWLLCVKLLCSPCLLCFVCCYTCCYPPDDQMCKYSAEKVAIID